MTDLIIILKMISIPFIRLAGRISWRMGRPFRGRFVRIERIMKNIEPGMVILTHKDFEFTNFLIRGYWTHAALVISGTEIVEAVGEGVTRKSLEEFFSTVDDFILLKPKFCSDSAMSKAVEFAGKAIGCAYNYYFIPRERSFFCTELVLNAYAYALGQEIPKKSIRLQSLDFAGGADYSPQRLTELKQYWGIV